MIIFLFLEINNPTGESCERWFSPTLVLYLLLRRIKDIYIYI